MIDKPDIKTAIPKRRYKIGEFSVVVLGDVDSRDGVSYQYVLAVIREGESEPGLYITAERDDPDNIGESPLSMRVIMRDGSEVVSSSARWRDIELFVSDALAAVVTILDLQDEQPFRLM